MNYSHIKYFWITGIIFLFFCSSLYGEKKDTINLKIESNTIPMPFMNIDKGATTGSYSQIGGEALDKYPGSDIRNAFTGLALGVDVRELSGDLGTSLMENSGLYNANQKISITSRGNELMYIIDDVPVDITTIQINPNEIESVSVIRDIVGKAMYGPAAANGIIYIKTKKGKPNQKKLNINFETGINNISLMPSWVNGVEYAKMNNLARQNSGLSKLYSDDDINQYAKNDSYNLLYPNINYNDILFRKSMQTQKINLSSVGGNNITQYFAYLGYVRNEDIYKIGPKSDINKINARANIDVKINNYIKAHLNTFAGINIRNSPNYGSTVSVSEFSEVINDITNIPSIAFPVYANNDPSFKKPWYAVSTNFPTNPIGSILEGGYYQELTRTGASNFSLDLNLSFITPGLNSKSFVSYNMATLTRIGKSEDYNAYTISKSYDDNGNLTPTLNYVHAGADKQQEEKLLDYYTQCFAFYQNLSYKKSFGLNNVQASLTYNLSSNSMDLSLITPQFTEMGVLAANYTYNNKYIVQTGLNVAATNTMPKKNQVSYSPTLGVAWIISKENFLAGNKFINYLKLRAEYGELSYDSFINGFYFDDSYTKNNTGLAFGTNTGGNGWLGSNTEASVYRTLFSKIGNPDLRLERRKEFNCGIDANLLDDRLSIQINYYNQLRDGIITRASNLIPWIDGINSYLPMVNYNKTRYFGCELGLQYNKKTSDFQYSVGVNATLQNSKIESINELSYTDVSRLKTGKPADAIFGYKYIGFEPGVNTDDKNRVDNTSTIKYADTNNDGVLDVNDYINIGHSDPRLYCAINASFKYKGFELNVVGTGAFAYDIMLINKYFTNGLGDKTYSNFVRDNYNTQFLIAKYSAQSQTRQSSFWMVDGSYFKIQNIEVSYNIPLKILGITKGGIQGIRVFGRGANLATITKVKYVDPENIDSGITDYPLFTTLTGGLSLTF